MSEAFEIGVTLALSDGVSQGIAQARRDMAAFEHVLTAGGVSVGQLRKAALEALSLPGQRTPERAVDKKSTEVEGRKDAQTGEHDSGPLRSLPDVRAGRHGQQPLEAMQNSAPVERPREDLGQFVNMPLASPESRKPAPDSTRMREPDSYETSPAAPMRVTNSWTSPSGPGDERRGDASAPPAMSQVAGEDVLRAKVNVALPGQSTDVKSVGGWTNLSPSAPGTTATPSDASGSDSVDLANLPSAPPVLRAAAPSASWEMPAMAWQAEPPLTPAAPQGVSAFGNARADASTGASASEIPGAQAPTEGDVFLDGMLVGRWMSRFLAQEAGRASVGPTGFDSRRSRLLPGPTVGN